MRRSRSRTGTPAKKEDATVRNADEIFGRWKATHASPDKNNNASQSPTEGDNSEEAPAASQAQTLRREPTEVILRGYRAPNQQYAAIDRYEKIAGRICEDYSREPPQQARRYKLDLKNAMLASRQALTPEERAKVNRGDGGDHWVKVTFESAQAAEAAFFSSPQNVQGHLVYAEPYRGIPPARDEPIPDAVNSADGIFSAALARSNSNLRQRRGVEGEDNDDPFTSGSSRLNANISPPHSQTSTRTISTGTVNETASTDTLTHPITPGRTPGTPAQWPQTPKTPGAGGDAGDEWTTGKVRARKMRLQNADLALLPQMSLAQRVTSAVPFLKWFTGSMIGSEVPRTDAGEFDWDRASLYWKVIWWMDKTFGLCGGEIVNGVDKDD